MTYHGDEPEDTPSWVSNTQEWLTDLDRDPDYISEYDDSEPDFDEADYPPDPDDDPDVVADNPAENTTTTTDDNDNTDAAAGTVDADPVSAAVPGDGDGINPFDTNGTDGGAPELADHDSSPTTRNRPGTTRPSSVASSPWWSWSPSASPAPCSECGEPPR